MSSSDDNNNDAVVAVGMDIGSLYARVAVSSSVSNNSTAEDEINVRIISNTSGSRSTLAYATMEENHVVILGEAAQRLLNKHKQDLETHTFHSLLQHQQQQQDNDENDLCQAFASHLASLAVDATSVQASQLRIVLSVPNHASPPFVESLVECTRLGMRSLVKQAFPKNKKLQKQTMVVGVLTNAAAVCVAHGLTDDDKEENSTFCKDNNILVLDWGASGMTLTCLACLGTSKILSVLDTKHDPSLSGQGLVELLAKHVATQFERKHKLPLGEVLQNAKARAKLRVACQGVLQSMSNSSKSVLHVTLDGLYEGLDCHVGISPPRWDMLTSSFFAKANTSLTEFYATHQKPRTVLLAGSVCLLPKVQTLVNDMIGTDNDNVYRGLSTIPPDEAVALGCARHATSIMKMMDSSMSQTPPLVVPTLDHVPTSPVVVGLRKDNMDTETLVGLGTPLPAHVTHTFVCQDDKIEYSLWQLTPTEKLLATLQDLPTNDEVEILIGLDTTGSLSIAVQGGEVHRL